MTKEITQEERLDLTDIKEEAEAYNRKLSNYCEAFGIDSKKIKEEYYHDITVNSNEYKKFEAENQRLKKQLNKEIHYNRKMKSCLSAFARRDNWKAIDGCADWLFLLDPLMAEETLKQVDNEE